MKEEKGERFKVYFTTEPEKHAEDCLGCKVNEISHEALKKALSRNRLMDLDQFNNWPLSW